MKAGQGPDEARIAFATSAARKLKKGLGLRREGQKAKDRLSRGLEKRAGFLATGQHQLGHP